jgi:hypothetical protein
MDASQICPKCGWAREPKAVECPACGIVYARYGGAPQREPAPSPSSGEALNPYAPPRSEVQTPVEAPLGQALNAGVWRNSASLLVMQKGMRLPNRCLVCNGPAAVQFPKKMHWHHPGLYLLLFLGGPLIYVVGAMIARKKADVVLPFCTEHAEKRKKAAVLSTLLIVIGLVAMIGSCTQIEGDGTSFAVILLAGLVILVAGAIVSSVGANLIIPKKIDDYYVWLGKVSGSYLSALPPAPPGL